MTPLLKLKLLAWLHIVLGSTGLLGAFAVLGAIVTSPDRGSRAAAFLGPFALMLSMLLFMPSLIGGIGLLRRQTWARFLIIALSLVELLLVPVGTVLGGISLWILFDRGVGAEFRAAGASAMTNAPSSPWQAPPPAPRMSAGLPGQLLAIAGVGAGFIVVIGGGFRITGTPEPAELSGLFYPALAVLALVIALGVRALLRSRSPHNST